MITEKTYVRANELLMHRDCPLEEKERKEILSCKDKFNKKVNLYKCSETERALYVICNAVEMLVKEESDITDWSVQQIIHDEAEENDFDAECFSACSIANLKTKKVFLYGEMIRKDGKANVFIPSEYADDDEIFVIASTTNVIPYMLEDVVYNGTYDPIGNLEKWQKQSLEILWGTEKYENFIDIDKGEDFYIPTENLNEDEIRMLKEANALYAIGERLQAEKFNIWDCFTTPESIREPHNSSAEICISILIMDEEDNVEMVDFDVWMSDACIYAIPIAGEDGVNTINGAIMLNATYRYLEYTDDEEDDEREDED